MRAKWSLVFQSLIRARLRRDLGAALSIAIVGCGPAKPEFDTLHPRETRDCSRHIDGSFYCIGGRVLGENDVGAIVFPVGTSPPLIEVSYSIVNGDVVRLDSLRFTAVSASGETIAEAKPALLLNPLVDGEDPKLGELPIELKGDGSTRGRDVYPTENRTLYRVVVTFDKVLPEQFDLRSPDVWLKDKKYPVRVFGFRNFEGRGLGLCQ
jgi:hypothetical protein